MSNGLKTLFSQASLSEDHVCHGFCVTIFSLLCLCRVHLLSNRCSNMLLSAAIALHHPYERISKSLSLYWRGAEAKGELWKYSSEGAGVPNRERAAMARCTVSFSPQTPSLLDLFCLAIFFCQLSFQDAVRLSRPHYRPLSSRLPSCFCTRPL